ncbi:N-acetylmuramic acid 6-phosphate etherase [Catenuloplanes atrovinosus]|uniref:N-acetylmuramic acid 6-phosphate etherase n=1 Tax=Catenuloplanes atrovinosus TaxID=137266 RepID=A0AAE4C9Q9_9ACTN|nr:N-acetylmuramic acid 6-phosphate etherase [Catenuloplanes atrovinosus]MDR7276087.1 N-acetylmuramic acid 6-phosphate etherase [Catenuloplanes atrovinosus]
MRVVRVQSPTEERNPATAEIDRLDTLGVLRLINAQDATVATAVGAALPELARAVELGVAALRAGGRVHYVGAGSSGRLGVMDAAEIPPTYGYPRDRFVAHLAGGGAAMTAAVEEVEDSAELGRADLAGVAGIDLVVGLAASGRTPYVGGAFEAARAVGAPTVLITANPAAPLAPDVLVCAATGPEAIAGSTRMKAGTAQKMLLHTFSTAVMIRMGRTFSNLMVDVRATNAKLRGRMLATLAEATGAAEPECRAALAAADGDLKVAITSVLAGVDPPTARRALEASGGVVRSALARLGG